MAEVCALPIAVARVVWLVVWFFIPMKPSFVACSLRYVNLWKRDSAPDWPHPLLLFFDQRSLWRSRLSARVTASRKLNVMGLASLVLNPIGNVAS